MEGDGGRTAWVATDICRALGIQKAAYAGKGLDDDEKGIATIYTLGGHQQLIVVYHDNLKGHRYGTTQEDIGGGI